MKTQKSIDASALVPRHERGSTLILAIFLLIAVASVTATMANLLIARAETTSQFLDDTRAFYAAESARMMGDGHGVVELDDDLHARRSFGGGEFCDRDEVESLGWVGEADAPDNATARHAICYDDGGTGSLEPPLSWDDNPISCSDIGDSECIDDNDNCTAILEDCRGRDRLGDFKGNLLIRDSIRGASHSTISGNIIILDGKLSGFSQAELSGKVCIGDNAEFAGVSGQSSVSGTVYLEGSTAQEEYSNFSDTEDVNCKFKSGDLIYGDSNCEGQYEGDHAWCGIDGVREGEGGSWRYARD